MTKTFGMSAGANDANGSFSYTYRGFLCELSKSGLAGIQSEKALIFLRTRLVEKKFVRITEEDPACYHASW